MTGSINVSLCFWISQAVLDTFHSIFWLARTLIAPLLISLLINLWSVWNLNLLVTSTF